MFNEINAVRMKIKERKRKERKKQKFEILQQPNDLIKCYDTNECAYFNTKIAHCSVPSHGQNQSHTKMP